VNQRVQVAANNAVDPAYLEDLGNPGALPLQLVAVAFHDRGQFRSIYGRFCP
jgi:hypothetical protein